MERDQHPKRSMQFLTIAILACMVLAATSLLFLPDVDAPSHIELSLIGDYARAVEPGQSVDYFIKVQNEGEYRIRSYDLDLSEIPEGWEAELSRSSFTLDSSEFELTELTVTSPSDSDFDNVAYISVRASDDTVNKTKQVGTITYTTSSTATVFRDGVETVLQVGDEILSRDRVWTHEDSTAAFRLTDEFFTTNIYTILTPESEIYVGYQNSSTPPTRADETEFDLLTISVTRGKVYFFQKEISANRAGDIDPEVVVQENIVTNSYVDVNLPMDGFPDSTLISVEVDPDDQSILTSMYQGSIAVNSSQGTEELAPFHSLAVEQDGTMGTADWISFDIVSITGNTELNITVDGKFINTLVNDVPGADILPVGDANTFILPSDTGYTIETYSLGIGEYNLTIRHQQDDTTTSYTFSNIAAGDWTRDTFEWDPVNERITFESNNEKTYDLEISYHKEETTSVFTISDVDQFPGEEQSYQVKSGKWDDLGDPNEKPVTYTRGDDSVNIGTGMDGTDITELLEEQVEEVNEHRGLLAFLTFLLIILIVGLFFINERYPYHEEAIGDGRSTQGPDALPSEDQDGSISDDTQDVEADVEEENDAIDDTTPTPKPEQDIDPNMDDDAIHVVEDDEIIEGEALDNEDADFGSEDTGDPDPAKEEDMSVGDEVRGIETVDDEDVEEGELVT